MDYIKIYLTTLKMLDESIKGTDITWKGAGNPSIYWALGAVDAFCELSILEEYIMELGRT